MESISTSTTSTPFSTVAPVSATPVIDTSSPTTATVPEKSKYLQPDKLALSEEAKAKSAEAEDKDKDKSSIDASSLSNAMTPEEAAAAEKSNESDIDKKIRELSMEILEISVQIQMLQDKEDKESVKERRSLEVDLSIKKGMLEAAMDQKLQQAATGA